MPLESWWPRTGSSLSPVLMKEDIHQLDCEVKTAYGSHVRYAQYADDFLFAIKPGYQEKTMEALQTIKEFMNQLKAFGPPTPFFQ